ncbi:MAG TPA: hypothetical protein VGQ36_09360 [Thermoanaerobaculia bacterium]|nr:hypothetical protein [Thermoanaerobaculia bacterium]
MKLQIAAAAFLTLLVGCGVDRGSGKALEQSIASTETEVVAAGTFALGTAITLSGAVPQDAEGETFTRGDEVFLSVDLSGVSSDPIVEVKWVDPFGQILRREVRHALKGAHHLPFSSGATARWTRGAHRAVVLIDGRAVSEKMFSLL